jgi:hypothetical protein
MNTRMNFCKQGSCRSRSRRFSISRSFVRHHWPGMTIPPTVIRRQNHTIMVTVTRHRESCCRLSPSLNAGTPFRIKRWGDEPRKHQHPALLLSSTLSTLSSPLNHLPFINPHHDVFWKALHHRRCRLRHRGQWITHRGQWIPRQWQWITNGNVSPVNNNGSPNKDGAKDGSQPVRRPRGPLDVDDGEILTLTTFFTQQALGSVSFCIDAGSGAKCQSPSVNNKVCNELSGEYDNSISTFGINGNLVCTLFAYVNSSTTMGRRII